MASDRAKDVFQRMMLSYLDKLLLFGDFWKNRSTPPLSEEMLIFWLEPVSKIKNAIFRRVRPVSNLPKTHTIVKISSRATTLVSTSRMCDITGEKIFWSCHEMIDVSAKVNQGLEVLKISVPKPQNPSNMK